jgi:hypothetical protein
LSVLTGLALLIGLLAAAPLAAHLLRRRRADVIALPTASLLAKTPPTVRRRSALEDRSLLAIRVLAVLLLALLGATPFVSCSHLSLTRKDGASIAMVLVIDDSASMRAKGADGKSRFERARTAAMDLADVAEPGDSFAIVLAGSPARVMLAPTTDLAAARSGIKALVPSDRSTDLEAALSLSTDLLGEARQIDKRVVLLSDLADGNSAGAPLDVPESIGLWYPVAELEAKPAMNCGVVAASRVAERVTAGIACSQDAAAPRKLNVRQVGKSDPVASAELLPGVTSVTIEVPADLEGELDVALEANDAISEDDVAPVVATTSGRAIGVVSDAAAMHLETGGRPPVEQALLALELGAAVRSLASAPEHEAELAQLAGLILDDPAGLTPEERGAIKAWVERGGILLLGLGPQAASAPLGASFGELVPGVVRFVAGTGKGAKSESCSYFGESAAALGELNARGSISLEPAALEGAEVLCPFEDGKPLLVKRAMGRGTVLITTLPFDLGTSDFPLRPAFLSLLDRFVEAARGEGSSREVAAGQTFSFPGASDVTGDLLPIGQSEPIKLIGNKLAGSVRVDAARIGRYRFIVAGEPEADARFAHIAERELDLRPRLIAPRSKDESLGGEARKLDISAHIALALLALLALELVLRLVLSSRQATEATAS